jgi:hypothetical protein
VRLMILLGSGGLASVVYKGGGVSLVREDGGGILADESGAVHERWGSLYVETEAFQ